MKKKTVISKNYLEKIPMRPQHISWQADEKGSVTLSFENKGLANKIAQKLFKKPKISYVHLDELGSFVWSCIDEKRDIIEIGKLTEERFGDSVNPLYERLASYFKVLESYKFVDWK